MKTNQLTKNSTDIEIRAYFQKVLQLLQLDEPFPIDLEEVWMLVYSRKQESVRALKENFIEDIDYQAMRKNAQRGAASPIIYKLSVSCLEYFIARKVRPVFEVYRQVFHTTMRPTKFIPISIKIRDLYEEYYKSINRYLDKEQTTANETLIYVHKWNNNIDFEDNIFWIINYYHSTIITAVSSMLNRRKDITDYYKMKKELEDIVLSLNKYV